MSLLGRTYLWVYIEQSHDVGMLYTLHARVLTKDVAWHSVARLS